VREIRIGSGPVEVGASVHGEGGTLVALGHGAGGSRRTPFMLRCAESLAASGRTALLFNFPYSERGRRLPDRPPVLEATIDAVARHARTALGATRLVLGGKSMGGRLSSQAVASGTAADALVFLGYPLHPPGRTDTLRDRHLPAIPCPMLFLQGTRDAFARWDLIEGVVARLGDRARLERLDGADHSFAVPRSAGRSRDDVEADLWARMASWLGETGL
jgi:predicted alpha/beta-hydrolase family hydrolase